MSIDLTVFSDEELTKLINEVAQEQERRKQEGYISHQVSERIAPIADALVESSPEILENAPASTDVAPRQWKHWHPLDPTSHFPPGCFVRHKGKLWKNMVEGKLNVWEPGAPGVYDSIWVEVPEPAEPEPVAEPEPEPEPIDAVDDEEADAPAEDPNEMEPPLGTSGNPYTWTAGTTYEKGEFISHKGMVFELAQRHTAQGHYEPGGPGLESIYRRIS